MKLFKTKPTFELATDGERFAVKDRYLDRLFYFSEGLQSGMWTYDKTDSRCWMPKADAELILRRLLA